MVVYIAINLYLYFSYAICNGAFYSQYLIYEKIFDKYDRRIRPNSGFGPVNVTLDVVVVGILDTDEVNQAITFNAWQHMVKLDRVHYMRSYGFNSQIFYDWNEPAFVWNPHQFNGTTAIEIFPSDVWMPDIHLLGKIDEKEVTKKEMTLCDLYNNGFIHCEFNMVYVSHYDYAIERFPFDIQNVSLQFGSWKYSKSELILNTPKANDKFFHHDNEWYFISFENTVTEFEASRQTVAIIEYFLVIQRKPVHYIVTLILPSYIITSLTFVGLFTPTSSIAIDKHEKVGLGLTMLLSQSVLLLVVADQVPKAASGIPPVVGIYILSQFTLGALACCITTAILHLQRKAHTGKRPPCWLFKLLRLKLKVAASTSPDRNISYKHKRSIAATEVSPLTTSDTNNERSNSIGSAFMVGNVGNSLKRCFAQLEIMAEFAEEKMNEERLFDLYRLICDRLDWICLLTFTIFNCLYTVILIIYYETIEVVNEAHHDE